MTRVFVTGMGVISCIGNDLNTFWSNLCAGHCGLDQLQALDVSYLPVTIGGEVRGLDLQQAELSEKIKVKRLDRSSLFCLLASKQALLQAGITGDALGDRFSIIVGAGLSGIETLQQQTERMLNKGAKAVSPLTIPILMPNAAPANVCLAYGITGSCYTVSSACSSSGHALINAYELLQGDRADVVITGGTEASLTNLGISAFTKMRAMSRHYNDRPKEAIRPFSADREGLIMSEGSAMLVLETEASVQQRGVTPLAEIVGYGSTMDAYHLVRPESNGIGASKAIRLALNQAGWQPEEIAEETYINAHGTATSANDLMETLAIKEVFGESAYNVSVSSTKSMTGHMIGATCAAETVACIQVLNEGIIPPTINLENPDPECDLNYTPNKASKKDIRYTLNNSFGFGGHNVCLAISKLP